MNMARQRAERCINPSEEVIQLGQLRVHFLVAGRTVGQHCGVQTDRGGRGATVCARL